MESSILLILTFDDAGRLWTQTAEMYPLDPFGDVANRKIRGELRNPKSKFLKNPEYLRIKDLYQLKKRGTDRVVVIDDPTKPVTGQVPAVVEGLTMPQSILPYKNGVFIAHGSEMLFMEDVDGDGKFEKPKAVLTGFSFIDTHTMSHTLVRGPGGWVHFSHGAMNLGKVTAVASGAQQDIDYCKIARFSLDGEKLELVSSGLNNIWGFQLRADGQWYGSEANDKSHSVVPMEPGTGFQGIGNDQIRPYQPMVPVVHSFRVGGTGISGLVFSDDDANGFPEEWQNLALLANPITNTINTVRVDRDMNGKISGTLLDDFLKSDDDWFRPVNMEFGPDGCLYVADWYNKIVSHNEVPRTDPSRDKTHGRIWRIRHESQKPRPIPNLIATKDADLAKHLKGPSRWEKRAAWHQIADRQVKSLLPEIKEIALATDNTIGTRIHAIWSYESLGEFDKDFTIALMADSDKNVRREITRSLATLQPSPSEVVELLEPLLTDPHCMVRSQVLRTLEEVQMDDLGVVKLLVAACLPDIPGNELGGGYERKFERYLARKALETYPKTLDGFLKSKEALETPISNLMWASQALGKKSGAEVLVRLWKLRGDQPLDAETFISLSNMLNDKDVAKVVLPTFRDPEQFRNLMNLVMETEDRINLQALRGPMAPAIKKFMSSSSPEDQHLAITVAAKLKSNVITAEVQKRLLNDPDSSMMQAGLPLLLQDSKAHLSALKAIAGDEKQAFGVRLQIVNVIHAQQPKVGEPLVRYFVAHTIDSRRRIIASALSQTLPGAKLLMKMYSEKKFTASDFDLDTAQRLNSFMKKNPEIRKIYAAKRKAESERLAGLDKKVADYVKAVETLQGNPQAGQGLFQSCLACHAVGDQGYDIAPALDGSANRELHALITAIVNPGAAVEGGYHLHRVIKKDGGVVEGYLYKSSPQGLTIASMGNVKTFISRADIQSEGSVDGRSFMPDSFGSLPEQTMADLVSYIQTLK